MSLGGGEGREVCDGGGGGGGCCCSGAVVVVVVVVVVSVIGEPLLFPGSSARRRMNLRFLNGGGAKAGTEAGCSGAVSISMVNERLWRLWRLWRRRWW